MSMIYGKSICETCGKEFEWKRHHTQPNPKFCNRKCTNKTFGVKGNKNRIFWPKATEEEKKERLRKSFEKKVVKKEGCWNWKGYLDKNGYPQLYNGNTKGSKKAHRFSYEIYKGEIPEGMCVCHLCDNPKCCNPDHLWIGTPKQNTEDQVKKNRQSKGEKHPISKMKERDVREIRKKYADGVTQTRLSKDYGVHLMTIFHIVHNLTWKHVKD